MGVFKVLMDGDDRVDLKNVVSEDMRSGNQWCIADIKAERKEDTKWLAI